MVHKPQISKRTKHFLTPLFRHKFLASLIIGIVLGLLMYQFNPSRAKIELARNISVLIKLIGWSLLVYVILTATDNKLRQDRFIDIEWVMKNKQKTSFMASYLLTYFTVIPLPGVIMQTTEGQAQCIWQFPHWVYCLDFYGEGLRIIERSGINFILFYIISLIIILVMKRWKNNQ